MKLLQQISRAVGVLSLLLWSVAVQAQSTNNIDFSQAENENHPTDPISFTNGALNANNSEYFEGIGIPQRVILTNLVPSPSTGDNHSINIKHFATKGGKHAYDFMMSWEQAIQTAANIGNGPTANELEDLMSQSCNSAISADAGVACGNLNSGSLPASNIYLIELPDMGDPSDIPGSDVDGKISCFESAYGNRFIEIRGDAAITTASINFNGYENAGGGMYASYTINWTSASTEVMIRFAGHLSVSAGDCGYGAGLGSGSISGAPYHFRLDGLDNASSGSMDNQIQTTAVSAPPPFCDISGSSATICTGNSATLSISALPSSGTPPYTFLWSTGAITDVITVSPSSNTNYSVTITDANHLSCSSGYLVEVNFLPLPDCGITGGSDYILPGGNTQWCGTPGMSYVWSGPGGFSSTDECVTVSELGMYYLTVTNSNHCYQICSRELTDPPFNTPVLECPPAGSVGCNQPVTVAATNQAEFEAQGGTISSTCPGGVTVSHSDAVSVTGCLETTTRTYTITDLCGHTVSCDQTITRTVAATPPSLTGNLPGGNQGNVCQSSAPAAPSESDIAALYQSTCSVVTATLISSVPGGSNCNWTKTYTYSIADACGNSAPNAVVVYSGGDNAAPVLNGNLPGGNTGNTCLGNAPAAPSEESIEGLYTENCSSVNATLISSVPSGDNCNWTMTYTYTVADNCGNAAPNAIVIYTGGDNQAPSLFGNLPGGNTGSTCVANAPTAPATGSIALLYHDNCSTPSATLTGTNTTGTNCSGWIRTYTYTVSDACGNTTSANVVYTGKDITKPTANCKNISVTLVGGVATITAGQVNNGSTDNCDANPSLSVSPSTFNCSNIGNNTVTLTVTDACGNSSTCTSTVTVGPTITLTNLTAPSPLPVCGLGGNTLTATATGANSYTWTVSGAGWQITAGQGTATITYKAGNSGVSGTFTVVAANTVSGCSKTSSVTFGSRCDERCSYTQGDYGSTGGVSCDNKTASQILSSVITAANPLVMGYNAATSTKKLTLLSTEISCIITKLPGGSNAYVLPGVATCATATGSNWINNNKFKSALLGQAIALAVNIRVQSSLGTLQITGPYLTTYAATTCTGGVAVTGTKLVFAIPQNVITKLGAANTVNDLLALANAALGGTYTPSGTQPNLGDITAALDAINKGFDRCRILAGFSNSSAGSKVENEDVIEESNEANALVIFPNPTSGSATIAFVAPSDNRAVMNVYSIDGKLISTVTDENVEQGNGYSVDINTDSWIPGIYFVRLTVGNETSIGKLVVIK